MNCEDTQNSLSAYLDDVLARESRVAVGAHLGVCPFCRQRLAEARAVVRGLAGLPRPSAHAGLAADICDRVMIEREALRQEPRLPLWQVVMRWIEPRVMPYTIGALTSLLLFFSLGRALRPHMQI